MQVVEEAKYMKNLIADRTLQLSELRSRMEENMLMESTQKRDFVDQIQSSLNSILAYDDSRRSVFQLSLDEDRQIVAVIY